MREFNVVDYRDDVEKLVAYLPWLEEKSGAVVSSNFEGEGIKDSSIGFPVYEAMLLNFVNDAQKTAFMDTNYPYVFSELFIKTVDDEKKAIERADVKTGAILCGILSKYVLGGVTRGTLWTQAVKEGIFLAVVKRMKELVEHWDGPIDAIKED